MTQENYIKFLGTAGARYVVAKQLRASGGVYISFNNTNIILDPGPGTLVKMASSRPRIDTAKIDALILSHGHIDHANDVSILLDAMTEGGFKKKGILFIPEDALQSDNTLVLPYLRKSLENIIILKEKSNYKVGTVEFETSIRHDHPVETYGIRFHFEKVKVSFIVDTHFFHDLLESYQDSSIVVINVVRKVPHESGEVKHLCLEDARTIIKQIKPKLAVLTHFGMTMLKEKPWILAAQLTEECGCEVKAATDGMRIDLTQ